MSDDSVIDLTDTLGAKRKRGESIEQLMEKAKEFNNLCKELPCILQSQELDKLKAILMANAKNAKSEAWMKRDFHRYSCRKCDAKCVYKRLDDGRYVLNKFMPHTCMFIKKKKGQKQVSLTDKEIAEKISFLVSRNPNLEVPQIMDVLESFMPELGIHDSPRFLPDNHYQEVYRAREIVREKVFGTDTDFQKLESIKTEFESLDKDNYFSFKCNDDNEYESSFLISGTFIRAAKYCAPVVSFDASHMKQLGSRRALGKMYLFTMKDRNNYVHVCVGHAGREETLSWKWFLKPLFEKVVTPNRMALISDEHSSICPAIASVDNTFTKWSACIVHRKANVRTRYGQEAADLFQVAASAYTLQQFEVIKIKIKDFSNELYNYCFGSYFDEDQDERVTSDERHYYRSKMTFINDKGDQEKYFRGGITSTQSSEIMNGSPGSSRSIFGGWWRFNHPIKMLLVSYNWYMKRFASLKMLNDTYTNVLTPEGMKIYKKRLEKSGGCTSTAQVESLSSEVFSRDSTIGTSVNSVHDDAEDTYYHVNLRYKTCTCNMFQEWEIPCKHAIALCKRRNLDPLVLVGNNWKLENYCKMYHEMGNLTCIKLSGYELDPKIKQPKHGPYGTVFDKKTEKEIEVCLCKMCGKKNIHKTPGPPRNARIISKIGL